MKKLFAILGALVFAAGAAGGGYYLGAQPDAPPAPDDEPAATAGDEPASTPDDTPPAFEEMMVGLWQNGPSVGSAISECYRFYADGTYTFTPSPFVFDPEGWRPSASEGRYVIEDDNVTLLKTKSTVIEGGTWVEDEIVGYALEGGTERIVAYPEPKEIYTVYLGKFIELDREMFCIDGRTYWKLSADPDAYLD